MWGEVGWLRPRAQNESSAIDRGASGSVLGGRSALVAARRTCCCPMTACSVVVTRSATSARRSWRGQPAPGIAALLGARDGSGQRCEGGCAVSWRWQCGCVDISPLGGRPRPGVGADPGRPARARRAAQAGSPETDRRPGGRDHPGRRGVWPFGADRAAPVRPARAQRPSRRHPGTGVRPVRGREGERLVDR